MWTSKLNYYFYFKTHEGHTQLLAISGAILLSLSFAMLVYILACKPSSLQPDRGVRGLRRAQILEKSGLFAMLDPAIRFIAGRLSTLPLESLRNNVEPRLLQAGDYFGLTPDEFLALSLMSGIAMGGVAAGSAQMLFNAIEPILIFMGLGLGMFMPHLQVQSSMTLRFKQLSRGLPFSIDLVALAMSAGLDFRGALRQVTDKSPNKNDAMHEELIRIQHEMDLGHTRRQALEGFAERCPVDSIKDFVASIVQAEEKGNPLVDVLNVQATMLRMRRSIAAEESAARAGVLMIGPLMMIFGSIMIILIGPFAVSGALTKGGM